MKNKIRYLFGTIFSKIMQNKIAFVTATCFFSLAIVSLYLASYFAHSSPIYRIENEDDLDLVREHPDSSFIITKQNISITKPWIPIGTKDKPFKGTFNGLVDGRKCTFNFKEESVQLHKENGKCYFGLFGYNEGTIKNIQVYSNNKYTISEVDSSPIDVGMIAAYNKGSISNCFVGGGLSFDIDSHGDICAGVISSSGGGNYMALNASSVFFNCSSDSSITFGSISGVINKDSYFDRCSISGTINVKANKLCYLSSMVGIVENGKNAHFDNCKAASSLESNSTCSGFVARNDGNVLIEHSYTKCSYDSENGFGVVEINNGSLKINDTYSNSFSLNTKRIFAFSNASAVTSNLYYSVNSFVDSDFGIAKNFYEITLEALNWDNKIWDKSLTDFIIKY